MSLVVFAVCLMAGLAADNPMATTLWRALVAMAGTLVVGLVVGAMAQKMLDEHLAQSRSEAAAARAEAAGKKTSENVAGTDVPQTRSAGQGR
jgi:hypothetical protein